MENKIVYNELIAITAGAALLGFAAFLADLARNKRVDSGRYCNISHGTTHGWGSLQRSVGNDRARPR
jgi:hypothetical protein